MLSTVVGLSGLVLNGPAAISSPSTAVPRASLVMMPVARIPGEGDPFRDGDMRRAEDIATKQPRGISDGSAALQYIETEDEPWHATCRPTSRSTFISKKVLADSIAKDLPFVPAEEALDDALTTAKNEEEVEKAVKQALADGARPGCPAIESAEKQLKAIAKAAKDGKPAPKYKPLKPAVGGASPGWANQGEGRKVAITHDNSV